MTIAGQIGAINRQQETNIGAKEFSELVRTLALNGFDPLKAYKHVRDAGPPLIAAARF